HRRENHVRRGALTRCVGWAKRSVPTNSPKVGTAQARLCLPYALVEARHARACPGHPRLCCSDTKENVDGRDKPGHESFTMTFMIHALPGLAPNAPASASAAMRPSSQPSVPRNTSL